MRKTVPRHLSAEARRWWHTIDAEYDLGESSFLLLQSALESFDRMRQAQAVIKAEGLVTTDKYGKTTAHPAVAIERDAKGLMLRNLKAMNLDMEPIMGVGRPSGG